MENRGTKDCTEKQPIFQTNGQLEKFCPLLRPEG